MESSIQITWGQMALAFVFVIVAILICWRRQIKRQKEIFIASIRMTIQLTIAGFILTWILNKPKPWITFLVLAIMEIFAVYNVFKRVKVDLPKPVKKAVAISLVTGSMVCLLYFILVVVRPSPWFSPQYFIPLGGMIIGNSMTAVTLSATPLVDDIQNEKVYIEGALSLGAEPKDAIKPFIDKTFDQGILPTINSMVGMGIVFLPGMMTGQILEGSMPTNAIKYQIAVMLAILGSVAISVILFLLLASRTFFNEKKQLVIEELEKS